MMKIILVVTNCAKIMLVRTLSLVGRVLSHFLLDPGPMNGAINRQINDFVT